MNIRHRTVAGLILTLSLTVLSVLHFLWASGNPFPAPSFAQLERTVIPQPDFPAAGLTVLVALALAGAAVACLLRVVDLNRGRHQRSRLLRIAIYALGVVFALRIIAGVGSAVLWTVGAVDSSAVSDDYRLADIWFYTPLCLVLSLAAFTLAGRPRVPTDLFAHTLSIFRREPFLHLVTLAPDGSPRSRVLLRLGVDRDGTVWMSTDGASEKADDIRADPRVVLSVYDTKAQAAATIEGDAEIVADPEALAKRWYTPLRLYFPRGSADERYALIRVTPRKFGVVDFSRDLTPEPFGLRRMSGDVPLMDSLREAELDLSNR